MHHTIIIIVTHHMCIHLRQVRHGLMLVGLSFGAKTALYK